MSDSDDQLDAELSELFDHPTPKQQVPPSPPRAASPPKRSLLQALQVNARRLSLSAANIKQPSIITKPPISNQHANNETARVQEVVERAPSDQTRTCATKAPLSARELMEQRVAAKKDASPKNRLRSASALQIVSASKTDEQTSKQRQQHRYAYHDKQLTNMSVNQSPYDVSTLHAVFEHDTRVDIGELALKSERLREGSIRNAVVFGVVVEKHSKKQAKDGSMYAVWTMYNMPRYQRNGSAPTSVLLLLFGAAFERWHNVVPGAVFAVRKPKLLPPRRAQEQQVRGVCLKVSAQRQLVYIGVCADYSVCEAVRYDGTACGKWYDANRLSMCAHHCAQKLKRLTSSSRMDVNNAVRPATRQRAPSKERQLSCVIPGDSNNARQSASARKGNKQQQRDATLIRRLKHSRKHSEAALRNSAPRRGEYVKAVRTLQSLGFVLDEHGSLLAPQHEWPGNECGPPLKRARTQEPSAEAQVAQAAAQLMQLSDESDSEADLDSGERK
eukprot:TRINITY_DN168_c1_g1_i6.p1 TRINITY_DN168_c1_g1~~TRINITY_DN168_c1_g1_i6.p1  ORF type:complete len:501 (+),score=105.87 TRINITY_DN168_c1_g1_i6:563-2065(+)